MQTLFVKLKRPHPKQQEFIESKAKRKVIRAGRRGGKTIGMAIAAVHAFLEHKRVLYVAPIRDQTESFWQEIKAALADTIEAGTFIKNESEQSIELPGSRQCIKAKTAWNADGLRGDYADLLIMDEYQLMNEDAWEVVGQPMLLDNNGDAVFIYTPPSLLSAGFTKARDPRHAARLFKKARENTNGMWAAFHFSSWDNPHLSREALATSKEEMSAVSYRQEIMAEDDEAQLKWLVYPFENDYHVLPNRFPPPPTWPVYVGHDFGLANPCAIFISRDPFYRGFYVFEEYLPGPGRSIAQHVQEFKKITAGLNVICRMGGNATTEEEIRQGYAAQGWRITAPSLSRVNTQVDRVTYLLEKGELHFDPHLKHLLSEIASCRWELDDEGKVTNEIENESRYHCLAALRYVCTEFLSPIKEPSSQKPTVFHGW